MMIFGTALLAAGGGLLLGLLLGLLIYRRQHRAAQQASQELAMRHERILEGTGAGTWEWNLQTGETRFNERWAEMLGYTLADLYPLVPETSQKLMHPDDSRRVLEAIRQHLRGQSERVDMEVRMRHRDGHWVWTQDCGRVMTWTADGRAEWMLGIHMDISVRRAIQDERDAWVQRFKDLSENVPGVLFQFRQSRDGQAEFPFVSGGLETLFGMTAEETRAHPRQMLRRIHPDDRVQARDLIQQAGTRRTATRLRFRVQHPDRGQIWVESCATLTHEADGTLLWHGYLHDVTELLEAREQISLAASVFQTTREAIFITDTGHRIISVNPGFTSITGWSQHDILGKYPQTIFSEGSDGELWDITHRLERRSYWEGELTGLRRSGECYPAELFISAVRDARGDISHYVAVFNDISERKAHQQALERIAHYDPLTGIPNRRLLDDRLRQALAQARRDHHAVAVCMLDLDGFKPVNDRYGHEAGDQVLKTVAGRLTGLVRAGDTVARLGGDEFVMVLRKPEGEGVFQRALEAIVQDIDLPGQAGTVRVSASMGIAYCNRDDNCEGDHLLRLADQAAYRAKGLGKNRFCIHQPDADRNHPQAVRG